MRVLWRNAIERRVGVELLFEERDTWIGVFWDKPENRMGDRYWVVYFCLLPCLPVRFTWHRHILPLWKRVELRMRGRG